MRLVIVSNRLPFTVTEREGEFYFKKSVGGLVSGLVTYLDTLKNSSVKKEYIWVGWPEIALDDESLKEKMKSKALSQFHTYPVFLPEETKEKFYYGFCNKTIWPLFHYFPSYAVYDEDYWEHYKRANEAFCDAIMEIISPDDLVWVHDYQLMLAPKLMREKSPDITIGFFLHIPFPSYEVFRLLPAKWRKEILEGLLGADLVGFHTDDYTEYFLRCVLRILGYDHEMGVIKGGGRIVKADTFPMGIDFERFSDSLSRLEVKGKRERIERALKGFKVILSVDRLDYTKGILNRLLGYELFLENNPQWHQRVVLALIVVPSRLGVEKYQEMKRQIDELVGKINGRFSSLDWTPILYRYTSLPFPSLVAHYSVSDVGLVTPLRDGMNLIAKEYIAARTDGTGVLILSEMAGASKELGEAIIINPNNKEEIAEALKQALEMPKEEQARRIQIMQRRLEQYDVVRWGEDFLSQLLSVKEAQNRFNAKIIGPDIREQLIRDYKKAKRRAIFLDYDGTLVPLAWHAEWAKPGNETLSLIKSFSQDPKTEVVLISGRDKNTIQKWFGSLSIVLVAEHGARIREKNKGWKLIRPLTAEWKSQLLPMLKRYAARVPGSFVEEKEFSVAWHYRRSDPGLASIRSKELIDDLTHFAANVDIQMLQGSKVVEVRSGGVNKGAAAMHLISKDTFDFILAVGDDWTDEDLFKALPETAYSIRVGLTSSHAKFNLHDHAEVIQLLKQLTKTIEYRKRRFPWLTRVFGNRSPNSL